MHIARLARGIAVPLRQFGLRPALSNRVSYSTAPAKYSVHGEFTAEEPFPPVPQGSPGQGTYSPDPRDPVDKKSGFMRYKRANAPYRDATERAQDWGEIVDVPSAEHLQTQAARCMD